MQTRYNWSFVRYEDYGQGASEEDSGGEALQERARGAGESIVEIHSESDVRFHIFHAALPHP